MTPRIVELVRFEVAWHRREFLTWLAGLVFVVLTFAWAAGGPVELVGARGDTPRAAPWAVAHAVAGVVAFGQLITTLVAATAVLRDRMLRVDGLVAATALSATEYLGGRFLGTLLVLATIYAVVPAGLVAGFAASGGPVPWPAIASATAVLAVPDVLVVAALCFSVGARAPAFIPILVHGVSLVALWQLGVALAEAPPTRVIGALLDPFGHGALVAATAKWGAARRAAWPVPLGDPLMVANRVLWFAVAVGALAVARAGWRWDHRGEPSAPAAAPRRVALRCVGRGARRGGPAWAAHARLALAWMARDRGVVALGVLAAGNAAAAAARLGSASAEALTPHVRLFAILAATVYAGELVWRERDLRADGVVDATPWRVRDRVLGAALALAAVLVGLAALAWPAAAWVAGPAAATAWTVERAGAAVAIGAVSLAVHALLQRKVVAHLVLVAAWVLASALGDAARTDPVPSSPGARLALCAIAVAIAGAGWWRGAARALRPTRSR